MGILWFYGWPRLSAIVWSSILLAYELGTPGHGIIEVVGIGLYVTSLIEAATFAWRGR